MEPTFFIGIDISKLTLDVAVLEDDTLVNQYKIENSEISIKRLLRTLKSDYQCIPANSVFCAENMGIYVKFILNVLIKKKARICLEAPLQIKLSLGIQRGKDDALDAIRIAQYANKNHSSLKFWQPARPSIEQLATLSSLRRKLIKIRTMLQQGEKITAHFLPPIEKNKMTAYTQLSLDGTKADIEKIEEEINEIIANDKRLNNLVAIMTSVPRIGIVTATEIIISTNEFKAISCPRKFASYCGIAPFPHTSGSSLKKKSRVSPIANKDMKRTLHMAAIGVTRNKKTKLGKYYLRKIGEGKNKMSVLNAVRNKLVHYIFACVRDNTYFKDIV